MDAVYTSGSWMDEDSYDNLKVSQVIRNQVFKNLRFVNGDERKVLTTNLRRKIRRYYNMVSVTKMQI